MSKKHKNNNRKKERLIPAKYTLTEEQHNKWYTGHRTKKHYEVYDQVYGIAHEIYDTDNRMILVF
jgi:hypothetical protein